MERKVFFRLWLGLFLTAVTLVCVSSGQNRRGYPTPPAGVPDGPAPPEPKLSRRHLDSVAMERESKEMAALAASIPSDVEQLEKGLLPSSTFDKLKRIEKLSKQLRTQMRP